MNPGSIASWEELLRLILIGENTMMALISDKLRASTDGQASFLLLDDIYRDNSGSLM